MTTDIRPLFLGCVALQPEELAFKLKSRVSHIEAAPLSGIGARSRKLSRLMSSAPSAAEGEECEEDEVQEALNHDGKTFTCAVTGALGRHALALAPCRACARQRPRGSEKRAAGSLAVRRRSRRSRRDVPCFHPGTVVAKRGGCR